MTFVKKLVHYNAYHDVKLFFQNVVLKKLDLTLQFHMIFVSSVRTKSTVHTEIIQRLYIEMGSFH